MKNSLESNYESITIYYNKYRSYVKAFIASRIPHKYDAEDLTQDVFVRLLDYSQLINPQTIESFLFTIARNLIIDIQRRYYKKEEIISYFYNNTCTVVCDLENVLISNELSIIHEKAIQRLSPKRRTIYELHFEEESVGEIAKKLNLAQKTIENHLYEARQRVRNDVKQYLDVS